MRLKLDRKYDSIKLILCGKCQRIVQYKSNLFRRRNGVNMEIFHESRPVWADGLEREINITCGFYTKAVKISCLTQL